MKTAAAQVVTKQLRETETVAAAAEDHCI